MRFAQMCESHYVMEVSLVREKPALRWDSKGAPYYLVAKGRHGQKIELYSSPTLTELESALTRGHRADWADFELSLLHSNSYAQNGFCYPIEDHQRDMPFLLLL